MNWTCSRPRRNKANCPKRGTEAVSRLRIGDRSVAGRACETKPIPASLAGPGANCAEQSQFRARPAFAYLGLRTSTTVRGSPPNPQGLPLFANSMTHQSEAATAALSPLRPGYPVLLSCYWPKAQNLPRTIASGVPGSVLPPAHRRLTLGLSCKTRRLRQRSPNRIPTRVSGRISRVGSAVPDFCRARQTKPICSKANLYQVPL